MTRVNKTETVVFSNRRWLPDSGRDSTGIALEYSVVGTEFVNQPEELSKKRRGVVIVEISEWLSIQWRLEQDALANVLFEYAKRHVRDKIFDKTLAAREKIVLTMANSPHQCPFDPGRIDVSSQYQFPVAPENPIESARPSDIASQIIDLRDNINALSGEKLQCRLLGLPQERNLLELFRTCGSQEEFGYRVPSLCTLAVSFERRSLDQVGELLRENFSAEKVNPIMDRLQKFNHLRRMYPVHTDRATGVVAAHQHFGLEYPIADYRSAWTKLLNAYVETLSDLIELLKTPNKDAF